MNLQTNFGCAIGDEDKPWAPHSVCLSCMSGLYKWLDKKSTSFKFAVPMIWREPKDHYSDCYFCLTPAIKKYNELFLNFNFNFSGFNKKIRRKVVYPSLPCAIRPVPHSISLPVPSIPNESDIDALSNSCSSSLTNSNNDSEISNSHDAEEVHIILQEDLNELVKDLYLHKKKAELLASRLKQLNLL